MAESPVRSKGSSVILFAAFNADYFVNYYCSSSSDSADSLSERFVLPSRLIFLRPQNARNT